MANEFIRKEFAGGAVETQLTSGISDVATSATVDDGSTLPTGTDPFVLSIGRDTPTEEKILCDGRTGDVLSIIERGYDGTTAVAHSAGASVIHVLDAHTVDQANRWANTATTQGGWPVKGAGTTPTEVLPGADGTVLKGNGAALAPSFGALDGGEIANDAITAAHLATDSVTADAIAAGAVGTAEIADDAITAAKIATGAVGTTEIADDAVTAAKIATGAVGAGEIAADAITNAKVAAAAAIEASKLLGVMESPDGTNWQILVSDTDPVGTPAANEIVFVY